MTDTSPSLCPNAERETEAERQHIGSMKGVGGGGEHVYMHQSHPVPLGTVLRQCS